MLHISLYRISYLFSAAVVDCKATEEDRSRQRSLRLACSALTVAWS
jgi:hypothetical protein